MNLSRFSIHAWLNTNKIKTERGEPVDFRDHMFLWDIFSDFSPLQVVMKPAQVGLTTLQALKIFWVAFMMKMEIIYTMPTDSDVVNFVGSRVNRFIANNPILQEWTKDRDNIETKKVGESMIYFKGTWTKSAAISVPADLLIHDELDTSKQDIVEDYETRVQHSKFKWRWVFSHPSVEGFGSHKYWLISDQKYWFITCKACSHDQYMSWPDSIDPERGCYQCKKCKAEIDDDTRRRGRWVKKYKERAWSGYWITALICPWIKATDILRLHKEKDAEYFYTKVLGLPYVGEGNKITEMHILKNLTDDPIDLINERMVIGLDTGTRLWYVAGTRHGMAKWGEIGDYAEIEELLRRYPRSVVVCDQGGDLIAPRKLREKYPGRIFLCHYEKDRKTMQLIRWGEGDEFGNVRVDRNRMISVFVGEMDDQRIPIHGSKEKWQTFIDHCLNIHRVKEVNESLQTMEYAWERSGPDHLLHAAIYWRVGLDKFGQSDGRIFGLSPVDGVAMGYKVLPGNKIATDLTKTMRKMI